MPTQAPADAVIQALIHRAKDGPGTPAPEKENTLFRVYESIRDICDAGEVPTRERIIAVSGLPTTTVDDRIKTLRALELISPEKQSYKPLHRHGPAQAVSLTALDDGTYKVEKGDQVMMLVPSEARRLGTLLAGKSLEASAMERVHELESLVLHQSQQMVALKRQVETYLSRKPRNPTRDLFAELSASH